MIIVTYGLLAVALTKEPRWQLRSIRYMFRLDHGTQLDWIFKLLYM
jgi:hypothetical protein